jgi:adenylate cyclase
MSFNLFFSSMTAAIRTHRGTLDKYIGDAIMAFWARRSPTPATQNGCVLGACSRLG